MEADAALKQEVLSLVPQQPPFRFIDEIISLDDEQIIGAYRFREDEYFYRGHFPGNPITPGVILIETMAQAGGAGLSAQKIFEEGSLFFLGTVDKVKFRHQVRPGDKVRIEIQNLRVSPRMIKQQGVAYIGDEIAAEATWMCLVGNADK